jgi:hypothetical protein
VCDSESAKQEPEKSDEKRARRHGQNPQIPGKKNGLKGIFLFHNVSH